MLNQTPWPEDLSGRNAVQTLDGPQATEDLAKRLAAELSTGKVFALSGDLGTGKTVFARALIREAARRVGARIVEVPSPTYTLVQPYELPSLTIFHLDLYRLSAPEEAFELGLEDMLSEGAVIVEWPERIDNWLPVSCTRIHLEFCDCETMRRAHIHSPRT